MIRYPGFRTILLPILLIGIAAAGENDLEQAAQRMIQNSRGNLAPVYAPLADQIVKDFGLAEKEGVGIDIGSGPGTLIIELCKRSRLHWINADINPHFFPHFYDAATSAGLGHRVSAIAADAQALPFRDNYADMIVSRGSFQFWKDKPRAFGEIYRVLKPGGVAYIGRGFSRDLPPKTARQIREHQSRGKSFPKYDVAETKRQLQEVMKQAGIREFRIDMPKNPEAPEISYGIWVEIRKPATR